MQAPLLVSTDWLAEHLDDPNVRIVDVRWYLFDKDKQGRDEYLKGHIPNAVFMDVDSDLAAPRSQGPGRHPLPKPEAFAQTAERAGIGPGIHVVAYDDNGGATAARLWWLLRYFGHEQVSLLDGGISRWMEEGRPLDTSVTASVRCRFVPRPNPNMVVNAETINAFRQDPSVLILDARAAERYEGKVEPIDPRAGHIPGAKNSPYTGNSRQDRKFREPEELRQHFENLGADRAEKVICYCGSGVNACQSIFALQLAGFADPILYEGSWSDWSSDPARPMATGSEPDKPS